MNTTTHQGGWVVFFSIVVAIILSIMPLPSWLSPIRPEWAVMTLFYWCIALPHRVGVGTSWATGLLFDVIKGTVLGQHALGFCLLAYISVRFHRRLRNFTVWQQALHLLILITLYKLLMIWIRIITGHPAQPISYWLPVITSILVWPLIFTALRAIRRNFKVH